MRWGSGVNCPFLGRSTEEFVGKGTNQPEVTAQ